MTRIYDTSFAGQPSINGIHDAPKAVVWRREGPAEIAWYTDGSLGDAMATDHKVKIAWLVEPPEINPYSYQWVEQHPGLFDFVLTHSRDWTMDSRQAAYFLFGTRIQAQHRSPLHPKTRMVSIIASAKAGLPGHRMRHSLIDRTHGTLDAFGRDPAGAGRYIALPGDKIEALRPYRFHVVIQSCRRDSFFTEALSDAFLTGAVPIYWGCPSIGDLFNPEGIIQCETLTELIEAVHRADAADYEARREAIADNFNRAAAYPCVEDWLYERYPQFFEESNA